MEELQIAREVGQYLRLLKQLARTDVLVLDDWGLHDPVQQRNLMELIEDQYNLKSTLVTSQYPVEKWHDTMADPTLADAILDGIVHNAHRIPLSGESMRTVLGQQDITDLATE